VNNSGEIVFPGVVKSNAGVRPMDGIGQGIFLADRNRRITKVVAPGDPAPGGSTFDYTYNPWINDRGDIGFEGHVAGEECISPNWPFDPGVRNWCAGSVYFKRAATGAIESIAHQGGAAPLGWRFYFAWGAVLNNRSDLVFIGAHRILTGSSAIYIHSQGITNRIAGSGYSMPEGRKVVSVNPAGVIGNYSLNNRGDVSFIASLEKGESGLYVHSQGELHLVAGTGTVISGVGTIASVNNLLVNGGILNDSGQIFFWATMTDEKGVLLLATPPPAVAR
jgi:hypothetical protein